MPSPSSTTRGRLRWILLGLVLGVASVALTIWLRAGGLAGGFEEVEDYFPHADAETIATWTETWHRRGDRWADVPDPPGEGPVVRARFWLARDRYDMEVRRRGGRFVVAIGGVAEHIHGGAWAAFGEGRITGDARDFRGAVATFSWSCLGLRYRHASDGVGRIHFSRDGRECRAEYMAWEAPELWARSYGRRHEPGEARPAYGTLRGQIPITPILPRLAPEGRYRVRVRVSDPTGAPVPGALIQLKGRARTRIQADAEGRGELRFRGAEAPFVQVFAAGAAGHRNGETAYFTGDEDLALEDGTAPQREVVLELAPLAAADDDGYAWNHPSGSHDPDDAMACGTCHPWHYDQWFESRHARSADHGHVHWEREQMLGGDPAAPDDCAGCHQPAQAVVEPSAAWTPRGAIAGNHCDFCHKIRAVEDVRASGVFGAYDVARPDAARSGRPGGIHRVYGSSVDATYAYMGAAYNPLFQTSFLCGGCHQGGGRWRTGSPPKIDTFEEWKRWAAARPDEEFRSCLDCHMPGAATFDTTGHAMDQMAWDALHRTPQDVHSHRFLGSDAHFAGAALEVDVRKRFDAEADAWIVDVAVTNSGAGHKIPTGTWSKHVVVGVWAERGGVPLKQVDGARAWLDPQHGDGDALAPGDWRNPGGFVLGVRARSDTDRKLALPRFWQAWRPDDVVDLRLAPGETRRATCRFEAGAGPDDAVVEVRVLYRRGWLPGGAASVGWTIGPNDPQPEVLWRRVRK